MNKPDKHIEEIETYEENLIEDLTVDEALTLVAVCAVKEKADIDNKHTGDTRRIVTLAQNHPKFFELSDSIEPSVNKFMNMIGTTTDLVKPVATEAMVLKPELNKVAFN